MTLLDLVLALTNPEKPFR